MHASWLFVLVISTLISDIEGLLNIGPPARVVQNPDEFPKDLAKIGTNKDVSNFQVAIWERTWRDHGPGRGEGQQWKTGKVFFATGNTVTLKKGKNEGVFRRIYDPQINKIKDGAVAIIKSEVDFYRKKISDYKDWKSFPDKSKYMLFAFVQLPGDAATKTHGPYVRWMWWNYNAVIPKDTTYVVQGHCVDPPTPQPTQSPVQQAQQAQQAPHLAQSSSPWSTMHGLTIEDMDLATVDPNLVNIGGLPQTFSLGDIGGMGAMVHQAHREQENMFDDVYYDYDGLQQHQSFMYYDGSYLLVSFMIIFGLSVVACKGLFGFIMGFFCFMFGGSYHSQKVQVEDLVDISEEA